MSQTPYIGPERRRESRPVLSRGPIVRTLEVIQAITALVAVASLIFSLVAFSRRLDTIQTARVASARDTCNILRTLIFAATPHTRILNANDFLTAVGLANCDVFGQRVKALK